LERKGEYAEKTGKRLEPPFVGGGGGVTEKESQKMGRGKEVIEQTAKTIIDSQDNFCGTQGAAKKKKQREKGTDGIRFPVWQNLHIPCNERKGIEQKKTKKRGN